MLDLFPSSLAAVLNLAGRNAAASKPRARALFWGERRSRERSDRYARPVGPVLTGLTGVVDRSNRFTIQSCVLKLPKFVEIRRKILKWQNQFLYLSTFMIYLVEP